MGFGTESLRAGSVRVVVIIVWVFREDVVVDGGMRPGGSGNWLGGPEFLLRGPELVCVHFCAVVLAIGLPVVGSGHGEGCVCSTVDWLALGVLLQVNRFGGYLFGGFLQADLCCRLHWYGLLTISWVELACFQGSV